MPDKPNDDPSWSSWLLVLIILILVAIALTDGAPRLPAFLRNLGVF